MVTVGGAATKVPARCHRISLNLWILSIIYLISIFVLKSHFVLNIIPKMMQVTYFTFRNVLTKCYV